MHCVLTHGARGQTAHCMDMIACCSLDSIATVPNCLTYPVSNALPTEWEAVVEVTGRQLQVLQLLLLLLTACATASCLLLFMLLLLCLLWLRVLLLQTHILQLGWCCSLCV